MSKRKTAEDNISVAVAVLQTTRAALFFGAKSLEGARKDKRIQALEWAICDALKVARDGP